MKTAPQSLKDAYSAAELAALKVPGYPTTKRGITDRAAESWPYREVTGRGGKRREYLLTGLPAAVRMEIIARLAEAAATESPTPSSQPGAPSSLVPVLPGGALTVPAGLSTLTPAPVPVGDGANLKGWQRKVMHARKAVLDVITRATHAGMSESDAIRQLIAQARAGGLPELLDQQLRIANARRGEHKRQLHRATILRWRRALASGGITALAPKSQDKWQIPAWGAAFLAIWQRPQKPSIAYALECLRAQLPDGMKPPSDITVRRFLARMATAEREAGRLLPREIKSLKGFVRRDFSTLLPGDVYTADGHTFDAEVAHPIHGQPFRPEITTVIDVATRRIEGWSVGLAESSWTVADAWRNAVENGGVNTLFYVDNGSGFNADAIAGPVLGIEARLGATITNSLPYNSQSRGVIERSHQTVWVRLAKTLPTYIGRDMDPEAAKRAHKITRAEVKAAGRWGLLPSWADFLTRCEEAVRTYNARPHRGLPRTRDPESGRMRHLSPDENRARHLSEGFEPEMLAPHEITDLFRPYRQAKTLRGEVRLFNNLYFHPELVAHHGEVVHVGYDIHDASKVWVRNQQEQLICVAKFEANKRDYFPASVIEQGMEKRAAARVRRLEAKLQEVRDELDPPALIEHQPAITLPPLAIPRAESAEAVPAQTQGRPTFRDDLEMLYWLHEHREAIDDYDWDYLKEARDKSDTVDREFWRLFGTALGESAAGG